VKIDAAYVQANTPIVREQLQKARSGSRIFSMQHWANKPDRL
jgi:hypothetical protein